MSCMPSQSTGCRLQLVRDTKNTATPTDLTTQTHTPQFQWQLHRKMSENTSKQGAVMAIISGVYYWYQLKGCQQVRLCMSDYICLHYNSESTECCNGFHMWKLSPSPINNYSDICMHYNHNDSSFSDNHTMKVEYNLSLKTLMIYIFYSVA